MIIFTNNIIYVASDFSMLNREWNASKLHVDSIKVYMKARFGTRNQVFLCNTAPM
jgi:hypothetical protein